MLKKVQHYLIESKSDTRKNLGSLEHNLGNVCEKQGKLNEAVEHYTLALEKDSTQYIYRDRGCCYLLLGEIEKAIKDFNKAIAMDSSLATSILQSIKVIKEKKNIKNKALDAFYSNFQSTPKYKNFYSLTGLEDGDIPITTEANPAVNNIMNVVQDFIDNIHEFGFISGNNQRPAVTSSAASLNSNNIFHYLSENICKSVLGLMKYGVTGSLRDSSQSSNFLGVMPYDATQSSKDRTEKQEANPIADRFVFLSRNNTNEIQQNYVFPENKNTPVEITNMSSNNALINEEACQASVNISSENGELPSKNLFSNVPNKGTILDIKTNGRCNTKHIDVVKKHAIQKIPRKVDLTSFKNGAEDALVYTLIKDSVAMLSDAVKPYAGKNSEAILQAAEKVLPVLIAAGFKGGVGVSTALLCNKNTLVNFVSESIGVTDPNSKKLANIIVDIGLTAGLVYFGGPVAVQYLCGSTLASLGTERAKSWVDSIKQSWCESDISIK